MKATKKATIKVAARGGKKNVSGGSAGAGGYGFQATVIARVYAALLRGSPFAEGLLPSNWPSLMPHAVLSETGEGGDDVRIELHDGRRFEMQAKKRATAGPKLWKDVARIAAVLVADSTCRGAIVCGESSSNTIRTGLRDGLQRLGEGRSDGLPAVVQELQTYLARQSIALNAIADRLTVITVSDAVPEDVLGLVPSSHVKTFWAVLGRDAFERIRLRGRRTLQPLMELAIAYGIDFNGPTSSLARTLLQYATWIEAQTARFNIPGSPVPVAIDHAIDLKVSVAGEAVQSPSKAQPATGVVERYYAANARRNERHAYDAHFILDFNPRVVVVGGPGAGKSLLLKRIAHRLSRRGHCVIRVSLRDVARHKEAGQSYSDALERIAFDAYAISNTERQRQRVLEHADCLIADGLDECAARIDEVVDWLKGWLQARPHVSAIISTRPIGFDAQRFSPAENWHIATIEPLDPSDRSKNVQRLIRAIAPTIATSKLTVPQGGERAESRWSSPLIVALAASLAARGLPLPSHEADLLRAFIQCYGPQPLTGRIRAWSSGSPEIRARVLQAIAATLRGNPSMEGRELVQRVSELIAAEIDTTPLAATKEVRDALGYWEDRALLETLHENGGEYYAFSHMQICESLAADYWVSTAGSDTAAFRRWVAAAIADPQQQEVLRSVACTAALPVLLDCVLTVRDAADDSALKAAGLAIHSGPERAAALPADLRLRIEAGLLAGIHSGAEKRSSRCAETWLQLPWTPARVAGTSALNPDSSAQFLCAMALTLRAGDTPANTDLVTLFAQEFGSSVSVSPSGGLVLHGPGSQWSLFNQLLPLAFDTLAPDSDHAVLAAAQGLLTRTNFSVDTAHRLMSSGKRLALDVSALTRGPSFDVAAWERSMELDREQDVWLLDVMREIVGSLVAPDAPPSSASKFTGEFRDIGAVISAINMRRVSYREYLDFSEPPDSFGVRAVIRGIIAALDLDGCQLESELTLLRPRISRSHSLISLVPDVAVLDLDRHIAHRSVPGFEVCDIVDALFHNSRGVAVAAANLILANALEEKAAPLIESRLNRATETALLLVGELAKQLWPTRWEDKLLEVVEQNARAGLHHVAKRLLDAGHSNDLRLAERVFDVATNTDIYEASALARLFNRFDEALIQESRLRRVFEHWIESPHPEENMRSYESPLVSVAQLMASRGWLTGEDQARMALVNRSEVMSFLKALAASHASM